jgi:hypothetical protein
MSKTYAGLGLLLALSLLCAGQAGAQQVPAVEKEPKTKLEAFQGQAGVVVIKGYSHIGRIFYGKVKPPIGTLDVTAMGNCSLPPRFIWVESEKSTGQDLCIRSYYSCYDPTNQR